MRGGIPCVGIGRFLVLWIRDVQWRVQTNLFHTFDIIEIDMSELSVCVALYSLPNSRTICEGNFIALP